MRVLMVDEGLPYPPDSGKRLRTYNLVKRLCASHEVTLLCRGEHQGLPGCPEVEVACVPEEVTAQRGPRFYAELLGNLVSPLPYVVTRHASRAFRETLDALLKKKSFDLVHCEWTPYAQNLRHLHGRVPMLLMAHNVESMIWTRYFLTAVNPLKKIYIYLQWKKLERFEGEVSPLFDQVCCVSGNDSIVMRELFGCPRTRVVPNGVDPAYFAPMDLPVRPSSMAFTGSMDWRPNQDGISWFTEKILPRIRREVKDASLDVVGRNPPPAMAAHWASPGNVNVTGSVPDVRPYVAQAALYVVPLRVGGGSRLKILEALAMGRPVLSTTIGAEGLDLEDGEHLCLRDGPESFADQAVRMLREPSRYAEMAERGRRAVLARHGWDAIASRLEDAWAEAAGGGRAH